MRKQQKIQTEASAKAISKMHDEIRHSLEKKSTVLAVEKLVECQKKAIELGNMIENSEGEGFISVIYLEEYCEVIFSIHEELQSDEKINPYKIYKRLNKSLIKVENSIRNDIKIRKEAVFLPYKASMWDSLESVWLAANEDSDCDAFVIPIPYFDKNSDGSFGEMHYEGNQFPEYVPIMRYDEYDFGEHHPDMIFIHNPYDQANYVTSIHPFFYSDKIKKYTDCLVYIPYYATSGGMSEGQALCPAYINADYIVIQSEKYRKFFDSRIPDSKFLALGSPKFDSIIRKCQNPPEPPEDWKGKMEGKRVYFYNTSINGMLRDTEAFLQKMQYVFDIFKGRTDVCLLWRPHPLLEATFDSMREQYKPIYDGLKRKFVEDNIGILDTTADIENTIALCDVYIGDEGTSVTALFGVAGKPLFILNNNIHTLPEKDDWRGDIIKGMYTDRQNQWYVTQGNKLYYSKNNDFHYEYFCDLSEYAAGNYYQRAIEFEDNVYICPINAQHILVISKDKHIKRIELGKMVEQQGVFVSSPQVGEYIFLLPNKYPALVRFNMRTHEVNYISGVKDIYVNEVNGEKRFGAVGIWNNMLLIGSPDGSKILKMEASSLKAEITHLDIDGGIAQMKCNGDEVWTVPWEGTNIACWDIRTGKVSHYNAKVDGFKCFQKPLGYECNIRPFCTPIFYKNQVILPPDWGNKFVCIDRRSGQINEWKSPIEVKTKSKNGYVPLWGAGYFVDNVEESVFKYYDAYDRKAYNIDVVTKECKEIDIVFDKEELKSHESGFMETSEWMQYCCIENSMNSLKDLLDNHITGNQFDRARQLAAFSKINASINGDCGKKVYGFIKENVQ